MNGGDIMRISGITPTTNGSVQNYINADPVFQQNAANTSVPVGKSESTPHTDPEHTVKEGYRSSPAECETCKNRKYQDGSDEMVSFKNATHISPTAAPSAVRAHEGEHVSNAYTKASERGGKVLQASVAIHTAICPECGRTYVSGGTTTTLISYPKDGEKSERDNKHEENFDT
jgi:hypothetical protein